MAGSNGRLMKELQEVGKEDTSGVSAKPRTEGNVRHLIGTINGPSGTVYEGGVFEVDITIPKQYPFEPPKMKFTTKVWHPNISSQTGAICLVSVLILRVFIMHVCLARVFCSTICGTLGYTERPMESRADYQNGTPVASGAPVQSGTK